MGRSIAITLIPWSEVKNTSLVVPKMAAAL
jgi:hypothetical protein